LPKGIADGHTNHGFRARGGSVEDGTLGEIKKKA
jgi:hypothetical protein